MDTGAVLFKAEAAAMSGMGLATSFLRVMIKLAPGKARDSREGLLDSSLPSITTVFTAGCSPAKQHRTQNVSFV
jgi:hypothetical protein